MNNKVLLIKPPFFTPWTPPLGIALLQSFLRQYAYDVRCLDLNTDSDLWGVHHEYFAALQHLEKVSINDGYSKLWWILNAHMLAYVNGASQSVCSKVLDSIIPLYGIRYDRSIIQSLLPIVEKYFRRLEELTDGFDLSDWKAVGTSTYTTSLASSLFILRRLKQKYPQLMMVMGGGVFADDLAPGSYNLNVLLQEYPFVDHIVIGEGELLLLSLLRGDLNKRVISIAEIEGTTLKTDESPLPDFSDFDLTSYYHLTLEGGRSCPFQCNFCSETVQWGKYRKKPMDLFAKQLIDLTEKYGNKTIFLADSLINPYVSELADELLKSKAEIAYDGYIRADAPVADRNRVKAWARSGLYRVRLGLESGSAHTLNLIGKRTSPQTYSEVLKSLAGAGIRTTTYWVVGFPGETEQDFHETLYFIREHHRYIYELEAHPYYYYPEGQVGSNHYQNYPLHSAEVDSIVKFRRWEIKDREPTREEAFNRLRKIAQYAADLNLPNIYTMGQRFQAEDRWQFLHPLASDTYGKPAISRQHSQASRQSAVFFKEQGKQICRKSSDTTAVLCYRVLVKGQLDEAILLAAIHQLVKYNAVLQTYLSQEELKDADYAADEILAVYSSESKSEEEIDQLEQRVIGQLTSNMSPTPRAALRVAALINAESQPSRILLILHRALADAKSVVLLLEDLARIYQQLLERKEILLRPTLKTYAEFLQELKMAGAESVDLLLLEKERQNKAVLEIQGLETKSCIIPLGENTLKRTGPMFATEYEVRLEEILAGGLLSTFARINGDVPIIDIAIDWRNMDSSLASTAGFLTCLVRLPQIIKDDKILALFEVKKALRNSLPNSTGVKASEQDPSTADGKNVLLNLEYLVDEPWLGNEDWSPQGFILDACRPRPPYGMEIIPITSKAGVVVYVRYQTTPAVNNLVDTLTHYLPVDTDIVIQDWEHCYTAKQFWTKELNDIPPDSLIEEIKREKREVMTNGWIQERCELPASTLNQLQEKSPDSLPALFLAVYSIFLSRLSGRRTFAMLLSFDGQKTFPLKITPSWNMSFDKFVQYIQQEIGRAAKYQMDISHFLQGQITVVKQVSYPVLDIGYVFRELKRERNEDEQENKSELYPVWGNELRLLLEVSQQPERLDLRFHGRRDLFDQQRVHELGSYLASILQEISKKGNVPIGYIRLHSV
ncbi:Anaerobic magnesium-protoporphyrin IX monomethyl ester cyclase [Thermoflexales bacterium]|nr:Anaerobic magnesium-protoporphyrin IX monomethyl ester cyclase [Thermoflexales bacterium]